MENNPCQTNPCLHGGSCLQEGDSYSCYCPQGFSGENCEIGESLLSQVKAQSPERSAAADTCCGSAAWGLKTYSMYMLVQDSAEEFMRKSHHFRICWILSERFADKSSSFRSSFLIERDGGISICCSSLLCQWLVRGHVLNCACHFFCLSAHVFSLCPRSRRQLIFSPFSYQMGNSDG